MPVNNAINKVITPTPTALAVPTWDSNVNFSSNNSISGFTTTVRSGIGTTYPLTVSSAQIQQFTSSAGGDAVLLPLTSTLVLGQSFTIMATSNLAVKDSTNTNTIYTIPAGFAVIFTCVLTSGATSASWYIDQPFRPVIEGTFTPTFTFSTVGDLSVVYTVQTGFYRQFPTPTGSLVWMYGLLNFTPTFTTAGGQARITVGTAPGNISPSNGYIILPVAQGINFGAGNTYAFLEGAGSSNIFTICSQGTTKTAGTPYNMTNTNFTTATAVAMKWEGWYRSS